jgi:HSP20 family protein
MITITLRPNAIRSYQLTGNPDYTSVNWRVSARPHIWRPPTDLFEIEDSFVVRVEIAGMNEDDFEIVLDQNILIIRGNRPDISERRSFHQMEINYGEFISAVEIHSPIETSSVMAEYKNGFLWISLPKAQPKHITIDE